MTKENEELIEHLQDVLSKVLTLNSDTLREEWYLAAKHLEELGHVGYDTTDEFLDIINLLTIAVNILHTQVHKRIKEEAAMKKQVNVFNDTYANSIFFEKIDMEYVEEKRNKEFEETIASNDYELN